MEIFKASPQWAETAVSNLKCRDDRCGFGAIGKVLGIISIYITLYKFINTVRFTVFCYY